jgi:hypothetical protein
MLLLLAEFVEAILVFFEPLVVADTVVPPFPVLLF